MVQQLRDYHPLEGSKAMDTHDFVHTSNAFLHGGPRSDPEWVTQFVDPKEAVSKADNVVRNLFMQ